MSGCGERGNELADLIGELQRSWRIPGRGGLSANERCSSRTRRTCPSWLVRRASTPLRPSPSTSVTWGTRRWSSPIRHRDGPKPCANSPPAPGVIPAEEGYPPTCRPHWPRSMHAPGGCAPSAVATPSVTIVTSVSPPGGDVTEPVTAHTERFVQAAWVLDRDLAYARHYPAVSWHGSSSRDADAIGAWFAEHGDSEWAVQRARLLTCSPTPIASSPSLISWGCRPSPHRSGWCCSRHDSSVKGYSSRTPCRPTMRSVRRRSRHPSAVSRSRSTRPTIDLTERRSAGQCPRRLRLHVLPAGQGRDGPGRGRCGRRDRRRLLARRSSESCSDERPDALRSIGPARGVHDGPQRRWSAHRRRGRS